MLFRALEFVKIISECEDAGFPKVCTIEPHCRRNSLTRCKILQTISCYKRLLSVIFLIYVSFVVSALSFTGNECGIGRATRSTETAVVE